MASSKPIAGTTEAYISHLKKLYGVKEDQELAKALGSTKAAVANWRRRDAIPSAIRNKVAVEFGSEHLWWQLDDSLQRSRVEETAYAAVLYILSEQPPPEFAKETKRSDNLALRGLVFGALLECVRYHIRKKRSAVPHDQLLDRLLDDFDHDRIEGVDDAPWLLPHIHD